MKRLATGCLVPVIMLLLRPVGALADEPPYRTAIDALIPQTPGLTIVGTTGGCDFLLTNTSGKDVILFDQAKKPHPFPAPKPGSTAAALPVQLAGAWPCATLPPITEDMRWDHREITVESWSILGQVGTLAFKLQAHTDYDPTLDPSSEWMLYLRIAAGVLAVGGLLVAAPYLYARRRQILAPTG